MNLSRGQYRKIEPGKYQCLWCKQTLHIVDNPNYWNFCPKCGKSWFKRLGCREHNVPRWYYDRYGYGHIPVQKRPESTHTWYIEKRTKWCDDDWGAWEHECSLDKDPCNPDYMWVYQQLRLKQLAPNYMSPQVQLQYRVRLISKRI